MHTKACFFCHHYHDHHLNKSVSILKWNSCYDGYCSIWWRCWTLWRRLYHPGLQTHCSLFFLFFVVFFALFDKKEEETKTIKKVWYLSFWLLKLNPERPKPECSSDLFIAQLFETMPKWGQVRKYVLARGTLESSGLIETSAIRKTSCNVYCTPNSS